MNPAIHTEMLAPAAVLVAWSLLVLLWTIVTRVPAFQQAGVDLATAPPGGRFVDVEPELPARVRWVAHNHNHLMEQPTLFYAAVVILALTEASTLALAAAWAYVGLRIAHSLWQNLVNTVPIRFALFALATLCLLVLTALALMATLT